MMDRGRPSRLDTSNLNPPTPTIPPNRPIASVLKTDVVRRKPVPSSATSASPATARLPSLSTGGILVAVGEENPNHYNHQSFLQEPPSLNRPIPASPTLVPRDLDQ